MNTNATLQQMQKLNLKGMASAYESILFLLMRIQAPTSVSAPL